MAVVDQNVANKCLPSRSGYEPSDRLKGMQKLYDGQAIENPTFEVISMIADGKNLGVVDPIRPEAFHSLRRHRSFGLASSSGRRAIPKRFWPRCATRSRPSIGAWPLR